MTIRQATPLIVMSALCLHAPAAAQQAPEPAPVRMALVGVGAVSIPAFAAVEAVLADSPRILRVNAPPPAASDAERSAEDSDAARAAWLRTHALEAALLLTQDGDTLIFTAVGPTGQIVGASRALASEVSTSPDAAQQATQQAVGLLGQPVLRWRQADPDAAQARRAQPDVITPPAEITPPVEIAQPAAPAAIAPEETIRVGLALRAAPVTTLVAALPADAGSGQPARDRTFRHTMVGLVTSLEPVQPHGKLLTDENLWFDIDLMLGVDLTDIFTFSTSILFGGILRDGEILDISVCGGMRSRLHLADADSDASYVMIQLDMLGGALRWQPEEAFSAQLMITGGVMTMPVPGLFGFSVTSQLDLRYTLGSSVYLELHGELSQATGFGYEEEPHELFWAMTSLGVGWWF